MHQYFTRRIAMSEQSACLYIIGQGKKQIYILLYYERAYYFNISQFIFVCDNRLWVKYRKVFENWVFFWLFLYWDTQLVNVCVGRSILPLCHLFYLEEEKSIWIISKIETKIFRVKDFTYMFLVFILLRCFFFNKLIVLLCF